ncbi:MAG: hypothetical protein PHE29_08875, partial [Tissierellia bacterium]|nr:hypothetical protein [Tissierellia bacterium]
MFEREDWKLFRNIDTLCQKAGVNRNQIPKLIIKELVDNALDVSECELKLLPDSNGFSVRDFGEGLEESLMEDLFSINRPMITSKLLRLPTRGALGNGLRVVIGAIISTNGNLIVETKGNKYNIVFLNDGSCKIEVVGESNITRGTKFNVSLGRSIYNITEKDLTWGNNAILMSKGESHTCKTSAFWYTSESFFELLNSYMGNIKDFLLLFEGINKNKVKELIDNPTLKTNEMDFEASEHILGMLRSYSKKVNIKKIGCINDNYSGLGEYAKKYDEFIVKSAKGMYHARIPYIVETWLRIQKEYNQCIYVNKTPITGEYSAWYDKGTMKLFRLGLNIDVKLKESQMVVNIMTPYMPITSDGKSPDFHQMNETIQKCLNASKSKAKKAYMAETEVSSRNERDIVFNHMEESINKAGGYGQYKFSQRQLYYAIRPYVMRALDKQPEYTYFCRLLTEYENEYGEINNLYRDPRGTLYHPHLGTEIPLGTIAVQNYERPEWTFNKILYCEKEGFFPILKDAKFPERFDCALLSSKGYASRAVKDLFDLLGETEEEILFFCIHDSDAAGTMIYETLQEATITRRARKVKVIDLGLNPWEAIDMELEIESVESKSRKGVAKYVRVRYYSGYDDVDYDNWLQENRIELNAMTTPQFLEWIEEKIAKYDNGKVIPDRYIMSVQLTEDTNELIKRKIMNEILRDNNFNEKVKEEIERIQPEIVKKINYLE